MEVVLQPPAYVRLRDYCARVKQKPEDRLLAEEQFGDLNRQFYAESGPHEYFGNRFRAVFLAVSGSELLAQAEREGMAIGTLRSTRTETDLPMSQGEREDYITIESTVLLHHAAEALMRLFIAHRGTPGCPWLEMSRERNPWEFRERLKELQVSLLGDAAQGDVMEVFGGGRTPASLSPSPPESVWTEHWESLKLLLQHLVEVLLSNGGAYNAAKHGLAARPGSAGVSLGDDGGNPFLSVNGPALRFLETSGEKQNKKWRMTTVWVNAESQLAFVYFVVEQMENLWNVARLRYVPGTEGARIKPMKLEPIRAALKHDVSESGAIISRMSMDLGYYVTGPSSAAGGRRS